LYWLGLGARFQKSENATDDHQVAAWNRSCEKQWVIQMARTSLPVEKCCPENSTRKVDMVASDT
jgi:hypothetical protein